MNTASKKTATIVGVVIAVALIAFLVAIVLRKPAASAESLRAIEVGMVQSTDDGRSSFGKECGRGILTAFVFSDVEVTDGGGNVYTVHLLKGAFPKDMALRSFWEKDSGKCHLVTDSGSEALRLNMEHAQALIEGTRGAFLETRPSLASGIGNPDSVGIRLPDGNYYLVDYYANKDLVPIQMAQKELNVFLTRRWNSEN